MPASGGQPVTRLGATGASLSSMTRRGGRANGFGAVPVPGTSSATRCTTQRISTTSRPPFAGSRKWATLTASGDKPTNGTNGLPALSVTSADVHYAPTVGMRRPSSGEGPGEASRRREIDGCIRMCQGPSSAGSDISRRFRKHPWPVTAHGKVSVSPPEPATLMIRDAVTTVLSCSRSARRQQGPWEIAPSPANWPGTVPLLARVQ